MKEALFDLLNLIADKTRSGVITWVFRPNPHGGIAYGLNGAIKFARVNKTFMFSYYRVGQPVQSYTIEENMPGWFLLCQLYTLVSSAQSTSEYGK